MSFTAKVAAIAAICGLVSFGSAHAAECVGSGHRSTFGVNAAVYFEVKSGGSCHYAFKMEGAVKNSKISAAPKNGTVAAEQHVVRIQAKGRLQGT